MATPTRPRPLQRPLKEPDPFALDATSEEFFAVGDRPTPVVEKIELELEEEDTEVARRSSPEVLLRRRRFRKVVPRVVCALSLVAIAAGAKSALSPANASAFRPTAVAMAAQPARTLEPAQHIEEAPPAKPAKTVAQPEPAPPPAAETAAAAPAPEEPAKVAHHAAKRDDDFSDLDVKIDVPKIDVSSLDVSVQ